MVQELKKDTKQYFSLYSRPRKGQERKDPLLRNPSGAGAGVTDLFLFHLRGAFPASRGLSLLSLIFASSWETSASRERGAKVAKNLEIFWMNNEIIIEDGFCMIWRIVQISEAAIHIGLRSQSSYHFSHRPQATQSQYEILIINIHVVHLRNS